jgi:hypothetical protein
MFCEQKQQGLMANVEFPSEGRVALDAFSMHTDITPELPNHYNRKPGAETLNKPHCPRYCNHFYAIGAGQKATHDCMVSQRQTTFIRLSGQIYFKNCFSTTMLAAR